MRKVRLLAGAVVLAGAMVPLVATPANADEVPCKIVIKDIYVIDLCKILP